MSIEKAERAEILLKKYRAMVELKEAVSHFDIDIFAENYGLNIDDEVLNARCKEALALVVNGRIVYINSEIRKLFCPK